MVEELLRRARYSEGEKRAIKALVHSQGLFQDEGTARRVLRLESGAELPPGAKVSSGLGTAGSDLEGTPCPGPMLAVPAQAFWKGHSCW